MVMYSRLGILCACSLFLLAGLPAGAQNADSYYRSGLIKEQARQYKAALKDFTAACTLAPKNPTPLMHRAILEMNELHQDEAAAKDLTVVVQIDPSYAQAWLNLGRCHWNRNRFREAVNSYGKGIALLQAEMDAPIKRDPMNASIKRPAAKLSPTEKERAQRDIADAYTQRAWAYERLGDGANARKDLEQAITLDPSGQTYRELAEFYKDAGKYDEALQNFNKAIERSPRHASWYYERARVYRRLKQYDAAIDDLTKAHEINPNSKSNLIERGYVHFLAANPEKAEADYSAAIALAPKETRPYKKRAWYYEKIKNWPKALADRNTVITLKPGYACSYSERASTYEKMGELDKSFADYAKSITLPPPHEDHFLGYARVAKLLNKEVDVKGALAKALDANAKDLAKNPNDSELLVAKGRILMALDQPKEALNACERALGLDRGNYWAAFYRALAYEKTGENERALQDWSLATRLDPTNGAAYYKRAELYQRLGNEEKSKVDFAKAKELNYDPDDVPDL